MSQLRGHYAFHATACTPATPREKGAVEGAVRHHETGFWPARRFADLAGLDAVYDAWRDEVALARRNVEGLVRRFLGRRFESLFGALEALLRQGFLVFLSSAGGALAEARTLLSP